MTFFQIRQAVQNGAPMLISIRQVEAVSPGPEGQAIVHMVNPSGDANRWDGNGDIECVEKYATVRKRIAKALGGAA